MAVEYDFDPEDDVKDRGTKSLKFTYKTKCVLRRCVNEGKVNSAKNYAGGIVGRMDLGSVLSCEGYGAVKAERRRLCRRYRRRVRNGYTKFCGKMHCFGQ